MDAQSTTHSPLGRCFVKRRTRLILALFGTTVVWAQGFPCGDRRQDEIPFETSQNFGVILIKAQVNGQSVSLVVDTILAIIKEPISRSHKRRGADQDRALPQEATAAGRSWS